MILLFAVLMTAATTSAPRSSIVYWGDTQTGNAVRVVNQPDAQDVAEREMRSKGGSNWQLVLRSDQPGFGAAMCTRDEQGVHFYVAHGFSNGRDAVKSAQEKARASETGTFAICSQGVWHVPELIPPRDSGAMGAIKTFIRDQVAPEPKSCGGEKTDAETKAPEKRPCQQPDASAGSDKRATCMCVRG